MSVSKPSKGLDLAAITQARLTTGARGRALTTREMLHFALDHARARDAVLSDLDMPACADALSRAGLETQLSASAAGDRRAFVQRPDLGRRLPQDQADTLAALPPCDVALVLGDGLSAIAAQLNGPGFLIALAARLAAQGLTTSPVILARQARVALGDGIAHAMGAQTVVMALGERPGLSAADSLGVYITQAPQPKTPDSARNCISNIREAGLSVQDAAAEAEALILRMRRFGLSGVALAQRQALPED
ncbi:MAG: ethanolamine ammonia-lyase subunit EutC [Rhodobacteraceae bacterium]|nr:ethanolamine ammonia-lyase subunit EutC [Paracoccaceae bacterium]